MTPETPDLNNAPERSAAYGLSPDATKSEGGDGNCSYSPRPRIPQLFLFKDEHSEWLAGVLAALRRDSWAKHPPAWHLPPSQLRLETVLESHFILKPAMSNPFKDWTPQMVEQHNAKVRKKSPPAIEAVACTSKRKPKRIRQSDKPKLNRLESEFQHHLQGCDAFPQVVRFELSTGLHYTPDFFSFKMMTAWEVKGPKSWEDSLIKLRMAAKVWTDIKWVLAWKEDGEWQTQEILP